MQIKNIITDSAELPLSGAAETLARNLIARLNLAYPAFDGFWQVRVNEAGGVVEVVNLALSGQWGFLMHIHKIDSEGRKVVRAAGELLERYRIRRSGPNSLVLGDLLTGERDFAGRLVADHG